MSEFSVSKKIKANLRRLLTEDNISEAELARRVKLPQGTINRLAAGRTPDPRSMTLLAIANYFNVSLDQLTGLRPLGASSHSHVPKLHWHQALDCKKLIKKLEFSNHPDWVPVAITVSDTAFALPIEGISMQPYFIEGQTIIIDPEREPKNKDFVIIAIDKKEVYLRQWIKEGSDIYLKPTHGDFKIQSWDSKAELLGVVCQSMMNFVESD